MFTKKLAFFLSLIFSIGCLSTAWGAEPIRIGMPGPLTGPYAHDGLVAKQSTDYAVKAINASGGVLGRQIKVYRYDVEDVMPEKVMAAAQDLVMGKKVNMVITAWVDYGVDVKAFGRYDVPYLSGGTSSLSVQAYQENPEKYWNFFEYSPTEEAFSFQGWPLMMKLPYNYPNKKVFIINEDDHWSHVIADVYEKVSTEDGWEVVGKETVAVGAVEWGGILTKIRATKPAIIMAIAISTKVEASFINQFLTNPTQSLLHFPFTPSNPEFKTMAGDNANGVMWNHVSGILPGSKQEEFKRKYIAEYGPEYWNTTYPAAIWDMMHFWKEAVEAVGKVDDYRAICRYIGTHSYTGLCGTFVFPSDTNTALNGDEYLPPLFYQIQEQKDVLLFPEKLTQGRFITPPWIK
jgi:branched-chain amino acid transport system substrate-binding protein